MVARLLHLQLALQRAGWRRNPWAVVGLVFGLLYALGAAAGLIAGAVALRIAAPAQAGAPSVLVWSILTLGWCLLPLLAFGVDATLDPGNFALLPLRAKDLMPGLLLAGFASAGGLFNLLAWVAFIIAWSSSVPTLIAAVLCGLVGVLTCFLLSRALTSALSAGLAQRKSRDLAAILLGVIGITFGLGMQAVSRLMRDATPTSLLALLHESAGVLSWTPLGWIWAVPWDLSAGRWSVALIHALLGVGLAVGLWFAWEHYLARGLTSPIEAGGDGGKVKANSRVDRLFPATPAGAVAARSLRYWRRDSRHVIALVSIIAMPLLILVPMFLNGTKSASPLSLLLAPAIIAMMVGIGMSNEISYDGSALWTHISCGLSGRDDRVGRAWALSVIIVPILIVSALGVAVLSGRWALVPAMIGCTAAIFGCALGAGAAIGAVFIVPTPPAGQRNAFNRGQSGGMTSMINLGATWVGTALPALPTIALGIASYWWGWLGVVALLVGALTGAGVAWWGIRYGGRLLDRRWPEALSAATFEKH